MSDWGNAFSLSMKAGAGLIDAEMRKQEKIEAEQRAADRQIAIEERLLATREMMSNRASDRFQALAQRKKGEQVPVTADPVTMTTPEGAKAAGLNDGLINMTREQVAAYKDPDMLAQFDAQLSADNRLAQEKVAGQMRPRTNDEAISAAMEEAKLTDIKAYDVGKKTFSDKYMQLGEGASIWNTQTGKLVFANTSKADRQQLIEEAKDERTRLTEEGRDRRHQESLSMQDKRLEASLQKVAAGSDKVLQHQFMNSLENDIRDAESRIKALEKTKASITTPKSEREAAGEAIAELMARKEMLRRSKIEFARGAGIKIPDSYADSDTSAPNSPSASHRSIGPANDPLGLFNR